MPKAKSQKPNLIKVEKSPKKARNNTQIKHTPNNFYDDNDDDHDDDDDDDDDDNDDHDDDHDDDKDGYDNNDDDDDDNDDDVRQVMSAK